MSLEITKPNCHPTSDVNCRNSSEIRASQTKTAQEKNPVDEYKMSETTVLGDPVFRVPSLLAAWSQSSGNSRAVEREVYEFVQTWQRELIDEQSEKVYDVFSALHLAIFCHRVGVIRDASGREIRLSLLGDSENVAPYQLLENAVSIFLIQSRNSEQTYFLMELGDRLLEANWPEELLRLYELFEVELIIEESFEAQPVYLKLISQIEFARAQLIAKDKKNTVVMGQASKKASDLWEALSKTCTLDQGVLMQLSGAFSLLDRGREEDGLEALRVVLQGSMVSKTPLEKEIFAHLSKEVPKIIEERILREANLMNALIVGKVSEDEKKKESLQKVVQGAVDHVGQIPTNKLPLSFREALDTFASAGHEGEVRELKEFFVENQLGDFLQNFGNLDSEEDVERAFSELEKLLGKDTSYWNGDGKLTLGIYHGAEVLRQKSVQLLGSYHPLSQRIEFFQKNLTHQEQAGDFYRSTFSWQTGALLGLTLIGASLAGYAARAAATATRARYFGAATKLGGQLTQAEMRAAQVALVQSGRVASLTEAELLMAQWGEVALLTEAEAAHLTGSYFSAAYLVPEMAALTANVGTFHSFINLTTPGPHHGIQGTVFDLTWFHFLSKPLGHLKGFTGFFSRWMLGGSVMNLAGAARVKLHQWIPSMKLAMEGETAGDFYSILRNFVFALGQEVGGHGVRGVHGFGLKPALRSLQGRLGRFERAGGEGFGEAGLLGGVRVALAGKGLRPGEIQAIAPLSVFGTVMPFILQFITVSAAVAVGVYVGLRAYFGPSRRQLSAGREPLALPERAGEPEGRQVEGKSDPYRPIPERAESKQLVVIKGLSLEGVKVLDRYQGESQLPKRLQVTARQYEIGGHSFPRRTVLEVSQEGYLTKAQKKRGLIINRVRYDGNEVLFYPLENGQNKSVVTRGVLSKRQMVQGLPLEGEKLVLYHANGNIREGTLFANKNFMVNDGTLIAKAGNMVRLRENSEFLSGKLAENFSHGLTHGAVAMKDSFISFNIGDGVVRFLSAVSLSFYDGRYQFPRGTEIDINSEGKLLRATISEPYARNQTINIDGVIFRVQTYLSVRKQFYEREGDKDKVIHEGQIFDFDPQTGDLKTKI